MLGKWPYVYVAMQVVLASILLLNQLLVLYYLL